MQYFNNHLLDENDPIVIRYQDYISRYPKAIQERDQCTAYVEKSMDVNGEICYRLRDKTNSKILRFWLSPEDSNSAEQEKGLHDFFIEIEQQNNSDLFKQNGDSFILINAIFGEETDETIEILSYMAELFIVTNKVNGYIENYPIDPSERCWQTGNYTDECICEFCLHKLDCSGYNEED